MAALPLDPHGGAVVELVPYAGHHAQAAVEQLSLFSWAEFVDDEPEPTSRHGRQPPPASRSLFEWALEREKRDGFSVAAG